MDNNNNHNLIGKKERLNKAIAYLKGMQIVRTQKEIAQRMNTNDGNFSRAKNGDSDYLTDYFLSRFSNAFTQFNESWLITGNGEMLAEKVKYKPEGRVLSDDNINFKDFFVIPEKGRGALENGIFDPISFRDLKIVREPVSQPSSEGSIHFKIEVAGDSMNDGTKRGLEEGDWAYCRSIKREYWRNKFHTHKYKIFCFFHIDRGIIFKSIKEQKPETGDLLLESLNPNKQLYPEFWIKSYDCSYICNVYKVVTEF